MTVEKSSFRSPSLEQETIESLSRKLFEANLQLKQLQQEREEMLANISHDLRAPITAIRSAVDYLRSGQPLKPYRKKNRWSIWFRQRSSRSRFTIPLFRE